MLRDTGSISSFIPGCLFTLAGNATLLCTETKKKYLWVVHVIYLKDLDEINDFYMLHVCVLLLKYSTKGCSTLKK